MTTQRPLTNCCYPGCHRYAEPGQSYCKQHRPSRYYVKRQSPDKMGYDHAWKKARLAYLAIHPLCVECQKKGIITPATDVDHIIAHRGNKSLFWNQNNWQALCHSCHSRKTVLEDGGLGYKK